MSDTIFERGEEEVKDALLYIISPLDSDYIYITKNKPDFTHSPFYAGKAVYDVENYLRISCEYSFDLDDLTSNVEAFLDGVNLLPKRNGSIAYFFRPAAGFSEQDITTILGMFSYCADDLVASHYQSYNWHIQELLNKAPFKEFIKKHYVPKLQNKSEVKEEIPEEVLEDTKEPEPADKAEETFDKEYSDNTLDNNSKESSNQINNLNKRLLL